MTGLESLFDNYKNAVLRKDIEAFVSIFDEKVRVFDMWGSWRYDGLVPWREMAKGWFGSLGTDSDVVTFSDIQMEASGDLGIASAFVRFTAVSEKGEELRYLENRLTWVARKKGEAWKIIHQHTSGPVDLNTMKVLLQREPVNS
jgi:ketosteroid isomerase-like protein